MAKRYYFGANQLNVVVPPIVPVLPDWTLTLVSALPTGAVTYTVPNLDASAFGKPDNVIVAFVPGATLDPSLAAAAVLALPGVSGVSTPFPPSFGIGLDQTVTVQLPAPLPVGPVVVVIVGEYLNG